MPKLKDGESVEALIADLEAKRVRISRLETALLLIVNQPEGCPACHFGKLTGHRSHWETCGYGKAQTLLGTPD